MFDRCHVCHRISAWNMNNIEKLRYIITGSCGSGILMGLVTLPVLGLRSMQIAARSVAAAIQTSISYVSLSTVLTLFLTLGVDGLTNLFFSDIEEVSPILVPFAVSHLNWCNNENHI